MKKRLLVDLSYLKDLYRGYGQIALNYANYFKESYDPITSNYELTLLVPKEFIGQFGNKVKYISSSNWWRKHFRHLMPQFDIWHNLQYPSRFRPYSKSTKYIFTIHDLNVLSLEYEKSKKDIQKNFRRIARNIKQASVITTISEFSKNQIISHFDIGNKKLLMIYNGVEKISNRPAQKPNCEIKKPFFFSISVFRPKKNFHVLLDMIKLMPEKHLYIAGYNNTEYGEMIKQRISSERITNTTLLGKVSEEEKNWLYANCEAFVFPSLFEGFGLPVIEAMQFGKPVFSSQETSLKEIGGNYSFFWENYEPKSMSNYIRDKIDSFYNNKDYIMGEVEYADSFSYENHFKHYEELYNEL